MKKRLFTSVLSVLLLMVISIFGFAGCFAPVEAEKTIKLNESVKELVVGESFMLTATTTPADAEIVWSSSNEAIVTVDNGNVLAISAGSATVTAKNDTATATCEITVKAAPVVETKEYTVVFKNGATELKSVEVAEGAAEYAHDSISSLRCNSTRSIGMRVFSEISPAFSPADAS